MALHWNLAECKTWQSTYAFDDEGNEVFIDGKRIFADEGKSNELWSNIQTIGLLLINLGYPKGKWAITEDNWQEVYTRIYMAEQALGAMRKKWDSELERSYDMYFHPVDIYELIGATTNSGNQTNVQADREIIKMMRRKAKEKINSFCKKPTTQDYL